MIVAGTLTNKMAPALRKGTPFLFLLLPRRARTLATLVTVVEDIATGHLDWSSCCAPCADGGIQARVQRH